MAKKALSQSWQIIKSQYMIVANPDYLTERTIARCHERGSGV